MLLDWWVCNCTECLCVHEGVCVYMCVCVCVCVLSLLFHDPVS